MKKIGAFCWLSLAICIVELLICIKFSHGECRLHTFYLWNELTMALYVSPINHNHNEYFITITSPKKLFKQKLFWQKTHSLCKVFNLIVIWGISMTLIVLANGLGGRGGGWFTHSSRYHVLELIQVEATNIYNFIRTHKHEHKQIYLSFHLS